MICRVAHDDTAFKMLCYGPFAFFLKLLYLRRLLLLVLAF